MANTLSHIVFASHAVFFRKLLGSLALLAVCVAAHGRDDFIRCPLADGFDYPVGKPNAVGYYKFRGFSPSGHLGEDWNGNQGGDTDLGDPVYSIATGVVVHALDIHVGWGNVVIVRHAFRDETGRIQFVDSLYGHLNEIKVKVNQIVKRGEIVGTIGTNHGMYAAHLHLEMHKNLGMGPNRVGFAHDYSNYYSPSHFIEAHRTLSGSFSRVEIPIHTFAPYGQQLAAGTTTEKSTGKTAADSGGIVVSPRRLSIPVYRGTVAPPVSSYRPGAGTTSRPPSTAASGSATSTSQPSAGKAGDTDDFWSRVKSKLKSGGLVEGANK